MKGRTDPMNTPEESPRRDAPQRQEVAAYYDGFTARQLDAGINDRIAALYRRTCAAGLGTRSRVLELGCGTGTLTRLLARHNPKGCLEAVDISPEAIRQAKDLNRHPHVGFHIGDVVEHAPKEPGPWDLITLFDVLEHIPVERHATLMAHIAALCHERTRVLIHLPTAAAIDHDRRYRPEALQIIDEPLELPYLATLWSKAGLEVLEYQLMSHWERSDYQWAVLRPRADHDPAPIAAQRSMLQRIMRLLSLARLRSKGI